MATREQSKKGKDPPHSASVFTSTDSPAEQTLDQEAAERCLEIAQRITGSEFGVINELNPDGTLSYLAMDLAALDDCKIDRQRAKKLLNHMTVHGILGQVVLSGKTVLTNHPSLHPARVGVPDGHIPLNNFLGVPLTYAHKVVGVIGLANKDVGFDNADAKDIEAVAAVFAEALYRRKTEQILSESEALFRATIESTDNGVLVVDSEGKVKHVNPRLTDMLGIPEGTIMKMNWSEVFGWLQLQLEMPGEFSEKVEQLTSSSGADLMTIVFKNGRLMECYSSPMTQGGKLGGRVWSFRDVSQIKRAEQLANLYLDLMGHDIRNHLQAISAGLDLLETHQEPDARQAVLDEMKETLEKCARMISKAKATERISETPLYPTSLKEAVNRAVNNIRTDFTHATIDVGPISSDANILASKFIDVLLTNIIENAVVHNPLQERHVWISLLERDEGYELSVADNGPGIDDGRKAYLFDSGRRFGGVGLHQTAYILNKYGGRIRVRDRVAGCPSQGADFRIWLPKRAPSI